jgi:hypothetical protein
MGKRVDQDATQELSASDLVPPKRPVYPKVPQGNDASMWMQTPVSADDFLSGPAKKPVAPRSGRGVMVALLVMLFVGVAGAGAWYALLRERPKSTSPFGAPAAGSAAGSNAAKPAVAAVTVDAAVAVAAADAGVAVDAGMSPEAAALNADAVSGADPAVKKSTKRATTKKKVAKKKTATAPKKKRRR